MSSKRDPGPSLSSGELARLRSEAHSFVAEHLRTLSYEVLEWRRTGMLSDGKLRELSTLCEAFAAKDDSLAAAEYLVELAALAHVATRCG